MKGIAPKEDYTIREIKDAHHMTSIYNMMDFNVHVVELTYEEKEKVKGKKFSFACIILVPNHPYFLNP